MDHMNYFIPYERKTRSHEDTLTRAFLVLVRISPVVRNAFLDLVRSRLASKDPKALDLIPRTSVLEAAGPNVLTQKKHLPEDDSALVSVLLANDYLEGGHTVIESTRDPVYDGIVHFPNELTLFIENKPEVGDAWKDQLNPSLEPGHGRILCEHVADLKWANIMESLLQIQQGRQATPSELELIADFEQFVTLSNPELNPYSKLAFCKGSQYLLNKRCKLVLESIRAKNEELSIGFDGIQPYLLLQSHVAQRLMLSVQENGVGWYCWLGIWPADNVTQARTFYRRLEARTELVEQLNGLTEEWTMNPVLHFTFIQQHVYTAKKKYASTGEYIGYWMKNANKIQEHRGNESMGKAIDDLRGENLITEEDEEALKREFLENNRTHIRVCPGLEIFFSWPGDEATTLDNKGHLEGEVIVRANQILGALGETGLT